MALWLYAKKGKLPQGSLPFHDAATFVEMETNEDLDAGDSTDNDSDWDYSDDVDGSTTSGNEVYFGTSAIGPDQGGDWNSFFHQFEAVASQSTPSVPRPSIVDDNVPLPIIRGQQFDIVYDEAMDEHVKCQVCGMLLRRTMFAAHVRQRHPEVCPTTSNDDDSGRHSGLESPDISRNPNFPFSPKLMSPPIAKEPIKLTISLKGHRKHKRRKSKRERHKEAGPSTSAGEERASPSRVSDHDADRYFWPDEDEAGPSIRQRISPIFLGERSSRSEHPKAIEATNLEDSLASRLSPASLERDELEHSSDEEAQRKTKKKSRRKLRRKEPDAKPPPPAVAAVRSRILPAVQPLRLRLSPIGVQVIGAPSTAAQKSPDETCRVASEGGRAQPETRGYLHARKASARSAFTDVLPTSSTSLRSPPQMSSLTTTSKPNIEVMASDDMTSSTLPVLVGQPARRARATSNTPLPPAPPVPTSLMPSPWMYSQSETLSTFPAPSVQLARTATVESGSFRPEAISFDPCVKQIHQEQGILPTVPASSAMEEQQLLGLSTSEVQKSFIPQKKSRHQSGSQEAWEPLGIKSPTYGIVLPVATRVDNDADDATVAFLTSSPELLSEDDSCAVKEEIEEQMGSILLEGMSPLRIVRQRFRSTRLMASDSSDTDMRTIIDVEEDQAERRSSDRDTDIQKLSVELAALPRISSQAHLDTNLDHSDQEMTEEALMTQLSEDVGGSPAEADRPTPSEVQEKRSHQESLPAEIVHRMEGSHIPVLDGTLDLFMEITGAVQHGRPFSTGEVIAYSAVEKSGLEKEFLSELDDLSAQHYLTPTASDVVVENEGSERPINVVISTRIEDEGEIEGLIEESSQHIISKDLVVGANASMDLHVLEEGNIFDDDYSVDDEELVSLHENSERKNEVVQKYGYDDMLRQQEPSSATPLEEPIDPTMPLREPQIIYQPPGHQRSEVFQQWPSQGSVGIPYVHRQLSVQTAFDNNLQLPSHHSDPTIQSASNRVPPPLVTPHFDAGAYPRQRPPHTFPLQRNQVPRIAEQQQAVQQHMGYQVGGPSGHSFYPQPQPHVVGGNMTAYGLQQREMAPNHYQQMSFQGPAQNQQSMMSSTAHVGQTGFRAPPYSASTIVEHNVPTQGFSAVQPQARYVPHQQPPHQLPIQTQQSSHVGMDFPRRCVPQQQPPHQLPMQPQQQASHVELHESIPQKRLPAELMEEEMKAMRYVYLMNEQRIAKKALAERDKTAPKIAEPPTNLMFLTELPPITVEPTVIPEGVPRARIQEHLLPPYHHAQFTARDGVCVSPYRSDSSEDEFMKLRDVLNLELLEPPAPRSTASQSRNPSGHKRNMNAPHDAPPEATPLQQQHPSNAPLRDERFSHHSGMEWTSGSQAEDVRGDYPLTAEFPPTTSKPQSRHSASSSKRQRLSPISKGATPAREEAAAVGQDEELQAESSSSEDSTDSEVLRRGWDLSPSVSPLTLEALSSGLSSPDGSESSDDQIGVPIWSTVSRRHAKLAIAVCRNMPKRFQALCRRFAWQQGITYLLENFCLQKWEIREEHDSESVWFFEKTARRFKPFDMLPWEVPETDDEEPPKRVQNIFCGFNICADIPIMRCRKAVQLEDRAALSITCEEVEGDVAMSPSSTSSGFQDATKMSKEYGGSDVDSASSLSDESYFTDEDECESSVHGSDSEDEAERNTYPGLLSFEKQEFIAKSCCKQFLQQMVARKKEGTFLTSGRSATEVSSIMAELYREHRAAYGLMIADILPIPTPDQREIPYSDNAEWVASRILAINRAQNRLLIPSFPPWATMHRLWKVYGPLQQFASRIGGDFEVFANECISVAFNHYYRLKKGIKVADEIPGDLLDLCYAITCERMREHTESVEAAKKRSIGAQKPSKAWVPLKRREGLSSFSSQRIANEELMARCRRVYDEKRQTKRRRWNTMRYLHNALPGCVIEGIDVFDMAQRTNLSVAGIFGPEHNLSLTEMPFASDMDSRPAYLDMEELLHLMNHTLALQSNSTVDQDGNVQAAIDFLTVRGLHFKAVTGERGRCHLMVSPAAIPVPPVTVDRYGNMTAVQRAAVPTLLYPELTRGLNACNEVQFERKLESPATSGDEGVPNLQKHCPSCVRTSEDYDAANFARICFDGLPKELEERITLAEIDTRNTTYGSPQHQKLLTEEDLANLLITE